MVSYLNEHLFLTTWKSFLTKQEMISYLREHLFVTTWKSFLRKPEMISYLSVNLFLETYKHLLCAFSVPDNQFRVSNCELPFRSSTN